jgi:hypothetical protein
LIVRTTVGLIGGGEDEVVSLSWTTTDSGATATPSYARSVLDTEKATLVVSVVSAVVSSVAVNVTVCGVDQSSDVNVNVVREAVTSGVPLTVTTTFEAGALARARVMLSDAPPSVTAVEPPL